MQTEDAGFSSGALGLARLKRDITGQAAPPQTRTVPLRVVAAAAVVAAIVGFAANEGVRPRTTDAPAKYVQASGEGAATLTVGFQGAATAQAISQFLLAEGLIIQDGPSALGLYRIAPVDAATVAGLA